MTASNRMHPAEDCPGNQLPLNPFPHVHYTYRYTYGEPEKGSLTLSYGDLYPEWTKEFVFNWRAWFRRPYDILMDTGARWLKEADEHNKRYEVYEP